MENLQLHFLTRIKTAQENVLHGNVDNALDILWELRVEPQLAYYSRALVNLSICDLVKVEDHPDKPKFAREALRLARELQAEPNPLRNAWWNNQYLQLISDAEDALAEAEAQEEGYRKAFEARIKPTEELDTDWKNALRSSDDDHKRPLASFPKVLRDPAVLVEEREAKNPGWKDWHIEGHFTLDLTTRADQSSPKQGDTEIRDELTELGTLPARPKTPASMLPTPPSSGENSWARPKHYGN